MIKDNEKIYDEEISPLMTKIIEICKEHELPMVAIFQYDGGENEPAYCTTTIDHEGWSEKMQRTAAAAAPEHHGYAFMETTITKPDGTKVINIKAIST